MWQNLSLINAIKCLLYYNIFISCKSCRYTDAQIQIQATIVLFPVSLSALTVKWNQKCCGNICSQMIYEMVSGQIEQAERGGEIEGRERGLWYRLWQVEYEHMYSKTNSNVNNPNMPYCKWKWTNRVYFYDLLPFLRLSGGTFPHCHKLWQINEKFSTN